MKTSRNGWMGLAVVMGVLIAGGAARGATFTWISAADGNWSDTNNWQVAGSTPAVPPNTPDNIVINDVASGTRTITLDATPTGYGATYWRYRSLVINQSTAGATNRLLFSNSLRMDFSEYQTGTSFNAPAGTVIMDTGTHIWEWNSVSSAGATRTFGPNVTINATGGSKMNMRSWHNSPSALIQGPVTVSSGTVTAFEGSSTTSVKTTFDTASTLTINANGVLHSINTIELKGTLVGDGTGGIRPVGTGSLTEFFSGASLGSQLKYMSGTIRVDNGAYFNGTVYLNSDNFDYRSNSANTDLRNVTIAPNGGSDSNTGIGGVAPYADGNGYSSRSPVEVTCNDDANLAWGIAKLTMKRSNNWSDRGALMLTDRYDNDPSSAAKEFLLVNNVGNGAWENLYLSDATQGYDIHVNGGVGNWQKLYGVHLDTANAQSTIKFLTAGSGLSLARDTYVSHGATLKIEGPATVSGDWLKFTNGGTFDFNGTIFTAAYNWTGGTATVNAHGNTVYGAAQAVGVSGAGSGPTLVIGGKLQNDGNIRANGTSKTWSGGAPVVRPAGTVQIQGNYLTEVWNNSGEYILGQFNLGRQATISVTGNFTQRQFAEVYTGDSLINNWWVDTSPDCGSLVFNGGGTPQTWETMSSAASTFTGLNFYSASATPVAGSTVTGASSGATATVSKVFGDLLKVTSVTGTFTADEVLNFSGTGGAKTARADAAQSVRPDLTNTAYPYPTVSIGEEGGNPAFVRLVNAHTHRRYQAVSASPAQIVRNLIVTPGSTFDLGSRPAIVSVGEAVISGLVTNSLAGGNLTLSDGAILKFETGGVIDVDTLTIGAGCKVDFNAVDLTMGSYIRVNGDQKAAFDALIAGGQIVDNGGGVVKTAYSDDLHTTVWLAPPPAGTLILLK